MAGLRKLYVFNVDSRYCDAAEQTIEAMTTRKCTTPIAQAMGVGKFSYATVPDSSAFGVAKSASKYSQAVGKAINGFQQTISVQSIRSAARRTQTAMCAVQIEDHLCARFQINRMFGGE